MPQADANPGDAIGRATGPNRSLNLARCRDCKHRAYDHEDDGVCDLCDCDGYEKE
jgi:hypothetical protein